MMDQTFVMDGQVLFAQLADKVARGEIVITHFVANLQPVSFEMKYGIRGEVFAAQSASARLDMTVTARENPSGGPRPTIVMMPQQVRELIFDDPPTPVYDEELK